MDARDFFGYKHADEEPGRNPDDYDGDDGDPVALPQLDEAITLDDPAVLARIDPDDMLGRVRELPRQMAQARRVAAAVELPARFGEVDAVVVLAMGGSAIGAELVVGIAGDRLRVPLIVHRDYDLPSWVGKRTLVIAASHSGETAETLAAVAAARRLGAPLAVITTGGRLGQSASVAGEPLFLYRAPGQPRAAVGFGTGLVHELLARAGLLSEPDPFGPAVEALESILERMGPAIDTDANPAKQLAWQLFGRLAVIYGGGLMAPVAHRWKTQINENAKAWASWEPMPEANHNAIEGSFNPRDLADAVAVVEVRDPEEPPAIAERYRVVAELLGERATSRTTVWAEGPSPLARAMTALAYGDLVSVYLAILYQTDPTPVTLLSMLKERLARATSSD
jgi:glucose/mannose-6-phosphate isomerase